MRRFAGWDRKRVERSQASGSNHYVWAGLLSIGLMLNGLAWESVVGPWFKISTIPEMALFLARYAINVGFLVWIGRLIHRSVQFRPPSHDDPVAVPSLAVVAHFEAEQLPLATDVGWLSHEEGWLIYEGHGTHFSVRKQDVEVLPSGKPDTFSFLFFSPGGVARTVRFSPLNGERKPMQDFVSAWTGATAEDAEEVRMPPTEYGLRTDLEVARAIGAQTILHGIYEASRSFIPAAIAALFVLPLPAVRDVTSARSFLEGFAQIFLVLGVPFYPFLIWRIWRSSRLAKLLAAEGAIMAAIEEAEPMEPVRGVFEVEEVVQVEA